MSNTHSISRDRHPLADVVEDFDQLRRDVQLVRISWPIEVVVIQFDRYWRVRKRLPERFGQRCRIVARGRLNSCLVEFETDGALVVTSRWNVRKVAA